MAIIESGGKSYRVHESADEVREVLRPVLAGDGDSSFVELDLVDGGSILMTSAGSVIVVTDNPRQGRTVGFG